MNNTAINRRAFLKAASSCAGVALMPSLRVASQQNGYSPRTNSSKADYSLHIKNGLVEIGKNRFVSTTTFNGQFPGPLLHFREGERITVDIHNETEVAEQLHWHGQTVSVDVDGAAEEVRRQFFLSPPGEYHLCRRPRDFAFITPIFARAET